MAVEQVILRLFHGRRAQVVASCKVCGAHDLRCRPFRSTPVKGLALADHLVESEDRFLNGGLRVRPVGEDKINIIQLQSFERMIHALNDVFIR